jgi:hypothetical protein
MIQAIETYFPRTFVLSPDEAADGEEVPVDVAEALVVVTLVAS